MVVRLRYHSAVEVRNVDSAANHVVQDADISLGDSSGAVVGPVGDNCDSADSSAVKDTPFCASV